MVDGGWTLYSHNHLLGFWRIVDDVDALTSEAQPRVLLVTARGAAALYAAPSVSLDEGLERLAAAYAR